MTADSADPIDLSELLKASADRLKDGLAIIQLEDSEDAGSFRLLYANPASNRVLGFALDAEIGNVLRDVLPDSLKDATGMYVLELWRQVALNGGEVDLGDVEYGDSRIDAGKYRVRVYGRPSQCVIILFDDVTESRAAQAELVTKTVHHDTVIAALTEGIVVQNQAGEIIASNPSARSILGLEKDEITGRTPMHEGWKAVRRDGTLFPGDQHPAMVTLRTGESQHDVIFGIERPNGERRWIQVNSVPINSSAGGSTAASTFHDVTERIHAEEALRISEERLRFVLSHAPVAVYMLDRKSRFQLIEGSVLDAIGIIPDEHIGSRALEVFPQDGPTHKALTAVLDTGEQESWTTRLGKNIFECRAIPLRNEGAEVTGLIAVAFDVSERDRARAEFERYARELRSANEDLGLANRELADKNRDLEQFAYVASHDLQEPLRMVSSFLQLLERRYADSLDESGRTYIQYAVDGAHRMQRLIRDLLAYSRVGTRALPPEPVDAAIAVEEVLADLRPMIAEHDAAVEIGDLPTVEVDPSQFRQLIQNLLSNAIKFVRDTTPQLSLAAEPAGDPNGVEGTGWWKFAVQDNGIGVDEQYTERVFQIFQRLHTREEFEGTGIGLAICKRIVERHGGQIWIEPVPSGGSRFLFTLPEPDRADPFSISKDQLHV
ncbi:hypothetical protein BH23BAC4_BH23BAC4_04950 [soil metagenome]